MIIETIYPYKISSNTFTETSVLGWVSNSGTPVSSGDIQYINKSASASGVDSTYIEQRNVIENMTLHFNTTTSSFKNNVDSAILRLRVNLPKVSPGLSGVGFSCRKNHTGNYDSVPYVINNGIPLNSSVYNVGPGDIRNLFTWKYDYLVPSGFYTKDIELTVDWNEPNASGINNNIDLYKNLYVDVAAFPSGTQLSSASILLTGRPSDGFQMNIIGDTEQDHSEFRTQIMELDGQANYRAWGRDDSYAHPTGVFSYYTNFSNRDGLSTANYNACTVEELYTLTNLSLVPKNPYNNAFNDTNKYSNGINIVGSGTYPGCYGLELNFDSAQPAWTTFLSFNTLGSNRTVLRLGKNNGGNFFYDSVVFSLVTDIDGDLFFNFYSPPSVWQTRILNAGNNNSFITSSNDSPTRLLISYSGDSLTTVYQPSGTFNFYIEDKSIKRFKYVGRISEKYDSIHVGFPMYFDAFGNRDFQYSQSVTTVNNFVSEVGTAQVYVSGVKLENNIQVMDDSRFQNLVNDRHNLERFVETSGDGRYVDIKIPRLIESSGTMIENVVFAFPSGNQNSLQFVSPFKSHVGNYESNMDAIYMEYNADIFTNHPSGVDLIFNINTQHNGNSGFISFESLNISSGNNRYAMLSNPKVYGYSDTAPIFFKEKGVPFFNQLEMNVIVKQHSQSVQRETYPTEVKLDYLKIYMDNVVVSTTGNNELTLYSYGGMPAHNDSLDLYLEAHGHSTDDLDLYVRGYEANNYNLPLYIENSIPVNSGMDLYMYGIDVKNTTIPFYLQSQGGVSNSGAFNLYMLGSTNSGITNSVPFFMMASGIYDDRVIPLYLQGGSLEENTNITLFIKHDNEWAGDNFELYLKGPGGQNSGIPLYIRGDGISSGYIPSNEQINFYISRERDDSTDERLRLYMSGPNESVQSTSFYVAGAYIQSSSIPLYVEGSPIPSTKNVKMYTHGF